MNKGKIIVLNGVSSSGKTTLAKALQEALDEPYTRLSIDDFINMMPEKLIKYRVRQASTTGQKRYKQFCTGEYVRLLYNQKNRMSGYSYEGYLSYLEKRNANDPSANNDYILNSEKYANAKKNIKKGHIIRGTTDLFGVLFRSKYFRPHVIHGMKIALISKFIR